MKNKRLVLIGAIILFILIVFSARFNLIGSFIAKKPETSPSSQPVIMETGHLTLSKNEEKIVGTGKLSIVLNELVIPDSLCRDCITDVKLEVKQQGQSKILVFQEGGFRGMMFSPQEAYGYMFKIDKVAESGVQITYYKK